MPKLDKKINEKKHSTNMNLDSVLEINNSQSNGNGISVSSEQEKINIE